MCLVSIGLLNPNKICPVFTFPQPGFSKYIVVRFAQPHVNNISIGLVSLGLENLKEYVPRFPQPHGANIYKKEKLRQTTIFRSYAYSTCF